MSSNSTDRSEFIDKAAVAAMVAFREKFDFSEEKNYKDCASMAFHLADAMYAEREERYPKEVPVVKSTTK